MSAVRSRLIRSAQFRFELATSADAPALLEFSRAIDMPGAIRFWFDRAPDYFGALRVQGRHTEVLVCRDTRTGRLVGTGHRSLKRLWVRGERRAGGYLSGLRLDPAARNGRVLAAGYAALRQLHEDGAASFYLTTIMEDNAVARAALGSGRGGLPRYVDCGRFCSMAFRVESHNGCPGPDSGLSIRRGCAGDGPAIVRFLQTEGPSRQFFPVYELEDFGVPGGLLAHLGWEDVFLAFRSGELTGVLAAWDQRLFRRWQVAGYAPWLRLLRRPLNALASWRRMPVLPGPGGLPEYFVLSLVCIRHDDRAVFAALLNEVLRVKRGAYALVLAGMHERDPLLPELAARPHVSLPSRLYTVAWDDNAAAGLDGGGVPYLELGGL